MNNPKVISQINIQTNGMPEIPAQFPGDMRAMYQFIRQRMSYPWLALEEGIEGAVAVSFVVNEHGTIEAPQIVNKLDFDCDQEALRLVQLMPSWKPAQNLGKKVAVRVQIPIYFQLANVPLEYE